ncbi:MAG: alpha/beta hydrolase [Chloroflexota bacterium]
MTLYVETLGNPDNETIVFLHGAGVAGWMWTDIATSLTEYQCVLYDLPGHGNSAEIVPESLLAMAEYVAEDIKTRFEGEPVYLVGLSLGGILTTLITARYPHLVRRGIASGVNALPIPNMWYLRIIMSAMTTVVKRDFYIKFTANMYGVPEDTYEQFYTTSKNLNLDVYKMVARDALDFRVPSNIGNNHTPMLFVAGENEHPVNVQSVNALANAFPNAQSALAPEAGHMWSAEKPDLFAEMIRAWLIDAPLPSALPQQTDKQKALASVN